MNTTPSPYGPTGTTLPRAQHRLFADIMPERTLKARFLELDGKPTAYLLSGLRAGRPKTVTDAAGKSYDLDVLVVAVLQRDGIAYEWEITAKTAYRDLRAILGQLDALELDALEAGVGNTMLELAVHGKGKSTTYTVRRAASA